MASLTWSTDGRLPQVRTREDRSFGNDQAEDRRNSHKYQGKKTVLEAALSEMHCRRDR